ncbi:hypothetical protein STEG23_025752, partial [Scotinomys teguina]
LVIDSISERLVNSMLLAIASPNIITCRNATSGHLTELKQAMKHWAALTNSESWHMRALLRYVNWVNGSKELNVVITEDKPMMTAMATSGGVASKEGLRYAEYLPPSTQRPDADIDHAAGRRLIVVGLAVAFTGRYAFQIWKPLEQVITETAQKISSPSLSSYYKGRFEQKMSREEVSLILGVSPSASQAKIRTAHKRITILNHPDKGGSPYLASKIKEAKDVLEASTKLN